MELQSPNVRKIEQKSEPADLREAEDGKRKNSDVRGDKQKSDPADLREAEDVEPQSSSVRQTKQKNEVVDLREAQGGGPQGSGATSMNHMGSTLGEEVPPVTGEQMQQGETVYHKLNKPT